MSIWRFASRFSNVPAEHRVTLGEGQTPLVCSRRIGPGAGLKNLYFKLESVNPTGSYKDRFAAAAISDMLASGKLRVIATSSGNTGSALAAYCAAAGLMCDIAIIDGAPVNKLQQMMLYGADIYQVRGFGIDPAITDACFKLIMKRGSAPDAQTQVSAFSCSPTGMAGVQTISYELAEQGTFDHVFCPAGGGGLTFAVTRGFADLVQSGDLKKSPAVQCVQPEGNDTIAGALRDGDDEPRSITCTSAISGLQVPSALDGDTTIAACRASGGSGHLISDDLTWQVQKRLALEEGIFCEPAGAVATAGALQAAAEGRIDANASVVCLVTGVGFKDQPSVGRMLQGVQCPTVELADVERMAGA